MATYGDFKDERIKHLELIQGVVSRLATDSFLMKGWAIAVAGVFFGFAVNSHNRGLAWASLLPTITFWGLDAYFLRCERLFRALFHHVREFDETVEPFFMAATSKAFVKRLRGGSESDKDAASGWKALVRPSISLLYGALAAAAIVVVLIVEEPARMYWH